MNNKIAIIFLKASLSALPAFAAEGDANIIIHSGYHTQQSSVLDAQTNIFQRHISLGQAYFFPNMYAGSGYSAVPLTLLDGTISFSVATLQRLGKGVSASETVEFYYRVHTRQGPSLVRKKILSVADAAWVESLNIPTHETLWGGDVVDVAELQGAQALEFWFKHTTSDGGVRWDSNQGRNYIVPVISENSVVLTVAEDGHTRVQKPTNGTGGLNSLRIRYQRQIEGCSMVGHVYFDGRESEGQTFSVHAFQNGGGMLPIDGIVLVPEGAQTAHVYFEPAPYQYACAVKRDPALGESWSVSLR
jgi:hypothetical protein